MQKGQLKLTCSMRRRRSPLILGSYSRHVKRDLRETRASKTLLQAVPGTRRGPGHKALLSFHILVFTRLTYKHKCSMTLSLRVRAHQRIRMCTVVVWSTVRQKREVDSTAATRASLVPIPQRLCELLWFRWADDGWTTGGGAAVMKAVTSAVTSAVTAAVTSAVMKAHWPARRSTRPL